MLSFQMLAANDELPLDTWMKVDKWQVRLHSNEDAQAFENFPMDI